MKNFDFAVAIADVCKRNVVAWSDTEIVVQKHPNDFNIQLSFKFDPWCGQRRYADIYVPAVDRWFLLFEYTTPQFQDHPDCLFHLQENTNIDGPDGIVDIKFSKSLRGCLNALIGVLADCI
jgi:hypothetical protein